MEFEGLEKVKSFSEAARKYLNVSYYNGRIRKQLIKYFDENGIDIAKVIKDNSEIKPAKCLQCGEEFIPKYKGNVFCSTSCAAKYNNARKGPVSYETRKKTSESLLKFHYGENWQEEIANRKVITYKKKNGDERKFNISTIPNHICKTCGNEFFSRKKDAKYCSPECRGNDSELNEHLRKIQNEKVKNGTHIGWKSRNIESYPENFWKKVLDNNSIKYIREDFSTKKYFLDFLIEKNGTKIDLEIDGKQHKYRKEHDVERDKFLDDNGFKVYRVKWNSINNEKGKKEMKEKIDAFIDFYKSL